jgi:hypothetical protein
MAAVLLQSREGQTAAARAQSRCQQTASSPSAALQLDLKCTRVGRSELDAGAVSCLQLKLLWRYA